MIAEENVEIVFDHGEIFVARALDADQRAHADALVLHRTPARGDGEVAVAGRIVRDDGPAYSAFETRTDRGGLEAFADGLRAFLRSTGHALTTVDLSAG